MPYLFKTTAMNKEEKNIPLIFLSFPVRNQALHRLVTKPPKISSKIITGNYDRANIAKIERIGN